MSERAEWTHWDEKSQGRPLNFLRTGFRESYGRPEEKVLINRHEVTITKSKDAWDMQEFFTYVYIRQLLRHPAFQLLLALLLAANAITIAVRTNAYFGQKHYELFSAIDDIVLTILMCEVLLGWFNGFWIFWKDGWNILNFVIVFMLVLSLFFETFQTISIVYTLRVLRLVQVCMAVEPLARILRVIMQSVPDMANIMALILFFMLVFSVFGVTLFGSMVPQHFQNMKVALYTLFICITQDGWVDIYKDFQKEKREIGIEIGGAVYFAIFITIGAFIGINLLVVVVTTNLEEMMKEREREQQQEVTTFTNLEMSQDDYTSDEKPELQLVHCRECIADWGGTSKQEPLSGGPMQNLSENTCDDFCLVLIGIQENLQAYKKIREEINKIVEQVRSIRFNQEQEEEMLQRKWHRNLSEASETTMHSQDILSRLLSKERSLDTRR
ncbi:cation channel sperm-associated protein 4 [Phascolarctos cinereus]|uniref:Cation channel sperm-associated protein 4 isoform X2 n=1 Tax=Phascolarctos cinereus TaxID=38626 RepID=A0A6P5K107_PHACI|nr:cation channel sperm-associated protein 4 isoform X2 [Phascolarctos cinereus]